MRQRLSGFVVCLVLLLPTIPALAQDEVKKIAFVVGVSEYAKDGLTNLRFGAKDAEDLAVELQRNGFEVTTVIGAEATCAVFNREFQSFIAAAGELGKYDIVLVSFSGHGVQKSIIESIGGQESLVEKPYFCVYDTLLSDTSTMVSLNWILEQLETGSGSSNNMLLVDACRFNPDKGAGKSAALDGGTVRNLPPKISILFSSSPGRRSYESYEREQGIFTHVLLQGLQGAAANSRGEIDWVSLAAYTMNETAYLAPELLRDANAEQRPNLVGNLLRSPVLGMASNHSNSANSTAMNGDAGAEVTADQLKDASPEEMAEALEFLLGQVTLKDPDDEWRLKELALSQLDYQDRHVSFPLKAVLESPKNLSWRVYLLPFIPNCDQLARNVQFDEGHDSEINQSLATRMPDVFGAGGQFTGVTAVETDEPVTHIRNVTDGLSNTIAFIKLDREVPWMEENDLTIDEIISAVAKSKRPVPYANYDASTGWLQPDISPDRLRAMLTPNGMEVLDE